MNVNRISQIGAACYVAPNGDCSGANELRIVRLKASAAALQYTGGGTVIDSEVGDEEGYYEVEVTLQDGTEVDVQLDQNFNVIGSDNDKDDAEDTDN